MAFPTENELDVLFTGNKAQLNHLVEANKERLNRYGITGEELEELEDEPLKERIVQVFSFIYSVVVDWREYDDEIIRLFGKIIPEEVEVEENDEGLLVHVDHAAYPVKLSFSPKDRYITIKAFNEIIKDKYELRLFEASYYSDTHEFLLLPNETWDSLAKKYSQQVEQIFRPIDPDLDFP
ncbi:hypothetical protein [Paenibacillus nasutitermitis]|uniref:Uncharacterized protein n=1 Tax=Paenibacillus nasutitermitis TaxID=1652958 RepID=A0A916YR55_9BACL|nr:hypothetical protein [Paenibacillus nasutitermitis]GGD57392.1 hypothetical protein GCM10010911_14000 [Paenibacillus nasutitermitis]